MALFVRPTYNKIPFDKEAIIENILLQIEKDYCGEYFAFECPDKSLCDIVLIKSAIYTIKTPPTAMKMCSLDIEKKLQQVIAVSIIDPDKDLPEKDLTTEWTSYHLIVSDSRTLFRKLRDL